MHCLLLLLLQTKLPEVAALASTRLKTKEEKKAEKAAATAAAEKAKAAAAADKAGTPAGAHCS